MRGAPQTPSRLVAVARARSRAAVLAVLIGAATVAGAVAVWPAPAQAAGMPTAATPTGAVHAAGAAEARSARRWQISAWTFGSRNSLAAATNAAAVDEVQLDWYSVDAAGKLHGSGVDPAFVQLAHQLGCRTLATVTNYTTDFDPNLAHAILASSAARAALVTGLVDACKTIGYDGVDLDFESVRVGDRDVLSSFVEQLASALHAGGFRLGIAIAAKETDAGDWSGAASEDYARLGRAVDEFQVMTYAYSGAWSGPGPIAPLRWTDRVLRYAESQVDPATVWMGLPFYGAEWWRHGAREITWRTAARLRKAHGRARIIRTPSKEARFTFRDSRGRRHTVCFQDRAAIAAKLDVLRLRHPGIAGAAIWVMGGEDPRFWPLLAARLAGP